MWGTAAGPGTDDAQVPFYFAYGSNMDRAAMRRRCPHSEPLGGALLDGFRFHITADGYASVVREPGSAVHGLLWRLDPRDEAGLDAYEEVAGGLYAKAVLSIRTAGGERPALIYLARTTAPGVQRAGYLEAILAAGEACGLPPEHLDEIRRWLPGQGAPVLR